MIKRKKWSKQAVRRNIAGWVAVSPVIAGILIFTGLPFVQSFYHAFTEFNGIEKAEWIGLGNFKYLLDYDLFKYSLKITIKYTLITVPVNMVLGFLFALLFNVKVKGIAALRVVAYLPCIIPGVISAIVWKDLFSPSANGRFNQFLTALGFDPFPFLSDPDTALFSMYLMGLWGLGGGMLLWISNMNAIPDSLYEAASIDGAGRLRKMFNITIPMLTPVILYQLVMGMVGSLQAFGSSFLMTKGGPMNSTYFMGLMIYETAFTYMDMGLACAMSLVMFVMIGCLTAIVFKTSSWVFYGEEQ